MTKIDLTNVGSEIKVYPIYRLIDGGDTILIELQKDKFISLKPHHISEDGLLCDDLETFIKWEMFSK